MQRQRNAIILLVSIIIILTLYRQYLTQRLDTNTGRVYTLQLKTEALKEQNTALKTRLETERSLAVIATKAAALGLVPGNPIVKPYTKK